MTEQKFQELFHSLNGVLGLNPNKVRLVATWTLAGGFVAQAVDCLPHLVFPGGLKDARDLAISLVAASIKDLRVELTRISKRRGIILIEDYDELSKGDKEGADIARDLLCGLTHP
jgi:hypothetical protein